MIGVVSPALSLRRRFSPGTPKVFPTVPRKAWKEESGGQGIVAYPARSGPRSSRSLKGSETESTWGLVGGAGVACEGISFVAIPGKGVGRGGERKVGWG